MARRTSGRKNESAKSYEDDEKEREDILSLLENIKTTTDLALRGIKAGKVKILTENEEGPTRLEILDKNSIFLIGLKTKRSDYVGFSLPEEQAGELQAKLSAAVAADEVLKQVIRNEAFDWKDHFLVERNKKNVDKLLLVFGEFLPEQIIIELKKSITKK